MYNGKGECVMKKVLTPEQKERKRTYDNWYNNTSERKAFMKEYKKTHKVSPEKSKEYVQNYENKYPGRRRENQKKFLKTEKGKAYSKRGYTKYRKTIGGKKVQREANIKYRLKLRKKAIEILGGKCSNPYKLDHGDFESESRCLQIDHINGGGGKELKEIGSRGIINKILKGETEGYQLLCANCNWLKRYKNKELPGRKHQT